MDRYAVIGNPIAHSKSPQIHAAFARATGAELTYEALLAPLDGFAATVRRFMAAGGLGANVTVPFKQEAYALADEARPRAQEALAANVLDLRGGRIVADNTDGAGLLRDLTANLRCAVAGRRVLLMGAGGASWGVAGPLLAQGPSALTVVNRTLPKAEALARHFAGRGPCAPAASTYEALAGRQYDIVINATSAGLGDAMPTLPEGLYAAGALAYDMMYGRETPFLRHARERGVRPDTAPVIALLRAEDGGRRNA
jgi:shikimate dehydrogenase